MSPTKSKQKQTSKSSSGQETQETKADLANKQNQTGGTGGTGSGTNTPASTAPGEAEERMRAGRWLELYTKGQNLPNC